MCAAPCVLGPCTSQPVPQLRRALLCGRAGLGQHLYPSFVHDSQIRHRSACSNDLVISGHAIIYAVSAGGRGSGLC